MKTIISLTTIPGRLPYIEPCINGLLAQGLPVYVWIPKEVTRLGVTWDGQVPDFLADCCVEVTADYGPITKLLPALLNIETEMIITADDDVLYGEHWAEDLIDYSEHHSGCVPCYRGRVFRGDNRNYNSAATISVREGPAVSVSILSGNWGALYRPGLLRISLLKEWEQWPMNDDIVISAHLHRREIERVVIPHRSKISSITAIDSIDSLWSKNVYLNDKGLDVVGWWEQE